METWEETERRKDLDLWTREIEAGIEDLKRHYIAGGDHPMPPATALEFLLFRAQATGHPELEALPLGALAVFASLQTNDYVRRGTEVDPGIFEKKSGEQARLLSALFEAWRASGRDMFRIAAIQVGDDLATWAAPGKGGIGTVHVLLPDSTADAFRTRAARPGTAERVSREGPEDFVVFRQEKAAEGPIVAASLLRTGVALGMPEWVKAARAIPLPEEAGETATGTIAEHLLAAIEAEPAGPHESWNGAPARLASKLLAKTPAPSSDPVAAGWTALALLRYGAYAHDDSATQAALRLLDALTPPDSLAGNREPVTFGAQAAAGLALHLHLDRPPMAYIVAPARHAAVDSLVRAALLADRPGSLVALHGADEPDLLYPADSEGRAIVYVCSGELCAPPTDSPAEVKSVLETFALPETDDPAGDAGSSPE